MWGPSATWRPAPFRTFSSKVRVAPARAVRSSQAALDPGTPSMIGTVLVGIGVDYFLFLLFRFREELRRRPEEH
ncbi:MMPL family transporter, partial [Streptomyces sp. NPDC127123]|uniref:MMPL family transporter n=1 Tax=Streptomyces sp. NPDC127123 TaxID=3345372 RepID=UPI0036371095